MDGWGFWASAGVVRGRLVVQQLTESRLEAITVCDSSVVEG